MPFCTNCGSKLKETDRFCSECGSPVKSPNPVPPVRQVNDFLREASPPRTINKDEMYLSVNDTVIKRGGNITGQAILNLVNSQKKGMRVLLEVVGEHRWVEWDENSEDMLERDSRFERIYEYRKVLDGEKEYNAGSHVYDFSISVPEDIEDWRFKRESFFMKKLGFKPNQYLDSSEHNPQSLTWYILVRFDKRQIGRSTFKTLPLKFIN